MKFSLVTQYIKCKVTGDCDPPKNKFIKVRLQKYANLHMTEKSQHGFPHVVFIIFIGSQEVHKDEPSVDTAFLHGPMV